jgi:hypothetical protein
MHQLDIHILGAAGELAAAKALGMFWPGHVNQYKSVADILPNVEVRHRTKPEYDLIVREDDDPSRIYVMTQAEKLDLPKIEVVGWIKGADAKKPEWLQHHGGWKPAYFVPRCFLFSMEALKNTLNGEV